MPENTEYPFALFNFHSVPVRTVEVDGKQHVLVGTTTIPCHREPMARFASIDKAAEYVVSDLQRLHGERFNDDMVPMWARPSKEEGN